MKLSLLFSGLVITVIFGSLHVVSQQMGRQLANDPQIQLAEDTATALSQGTLTADSLSKIPKVDIAHSLAPFVIIYDQNGKPVSGTGQLSDSLPTIPKGVLDYAKVHSQNRVTWQPTTDLRFATVTVPYTHGQESGFVMAARSLSETEARTNTLGQKLLLAWIGTLGLSWLGMGLMAKKA